MQPNVKATVSGLVNLDVPFPQGNEATSGGAYSTSIVHLLLALAQGITGLLYEISALRDAWVEASGGKPSAGRLPITVSSLNMALNEAYRIVDPGLGDMVRMLVHSLDVSAEQLTSLREEWGAAPGPCGDASGVTYTPDEGADWDAPDPDDVASALDQLADRQDDSEILLADHNVQHETGGDDPVDLTDQFLQRNGALPIDDDASVDFGDGADWSLFYDSADDHFKLTTTTSGKWFKISNGIYIDETSETYGRLLLLLKSDYDLTVNDKLGYQVTVKESTPGANNLYGTKAYARADHTEGEQSGNIVGFSGLAATQNNNADCTGSLIGGQLQAVAFFDVSVARLKGGEVKVGSAGDNEATIGEAIGIDVLGMDCGLAACTTSMGVKVGAHTDTGAGSYTNIYGIYLEEQTVGGSKNHELFFEGAGGAFFRDSAIYIHSDVDGKLHIVADVEVTLDSDVKIIGNLDMDGGTISNATWNHASNHTDGTDDVQDATAAQKGLMTLAYADKLDGIEALADVTDGTNVNSAGAVMESDFAAKGDLITATADDAPTILTAGSDGRILVADSGEAKGLKYVDDADVWNIEIPTPTTDDEYLMKAIPHDVTFTECYYHVVTGTGTVSFDIIRRARSSSAAGGTDITASPMSAGTTGAATTSFANSGDGTADEWLIFKVTAITSVPTLLRVALKWKRRV